MKYSITHYLWIHGPLTFKASSGAHDHNFIWLLPFCHYPVLNRGTCVKGQGFYPLGHSHWQLPRVFGKFYLPVLTFTYHKGKHIMRDRFESCYHPKSTRDKEQPRPHSPEHFNNHVWCQSQSQAQARYLTIYKCRSLASIFHAFTWMH